MAKKSRKRKLRPEGKEVGDTSAEAGRSECAIRERPDLLHRLPEVKAPALVLVGEWDSFLPCSRLAHQAIKGSRFVLVRRAGHGTSTWRPEAFQRAISEFLNAVQAGQPVAGEFEVLGEDGGSTPHPNGH